MNDPSAYWLNVTNAVLGLVVLICCVAVTVGIALELAANRKKRRGLAALDREVSQMVGAFDSHTFNVPSLGLTMADGGEPVRKKEETR